MAASEEHPDELYASFDGRLYDEWEGTPQVDMLFRGLKINGPKQVVIGRRGDAADGTLVIAGTYMIGDELPAEIGNPDDAIVLVAVDEASNEIHSGTLGDAGDPAEPLEPDPNPPPTGVVTQGYFNPNLFEFLTLPYKETTYVVYVTLGPLRSNALRVQVKKAK